MSSRIKILVLVIISLLTFSLKAQDVRTLDTKVADLLARMPAGSKELTVKLMDEMCQMGEEGTSIICRQVVPSGKGDDSRVRYAVYSLTAYLSGSNDLEKKAFWEKQCIRFMQSADDNEVRSFFMMQLGMIGSEASVKAIQRYLSDAALCGNAVMILQSIGSDEAKNTLITALRSDPCYCASGLMNALGEVHYKNGADTYILWYNKGTQDEKSSALFALANSGDIKALPVLTGAAGSVGFKWDATGAVNNLLLFARNAGLEGDIKTTEKVADLILSKCSGFGASGQRLAAMNLLVDFNGTEALPLLLKSCDDPDIAVREGALRLASKVPGPQATKKWLAQYNKVNAEAKPGIIHMLGERGDHLAMPLITKALDDPSTAIQQEAVTALAKLEGNKEIEPLLKWINKSSSEEGHWTAANAMMTLIDSTSIQTVASYLGISKGHSTVTLIYILSQAGDTRYFKTVASYFNSDDIGIKASALTALKNVASYNDQEALISMLSGTSERPEVTELQDALAAAAMHAPDIEERSKVILKALDKGGPALKLIPVLPLLGGEAALARVLAEFNKGDAETRDICFDALQRWCDVSATSALYDICASENKTYGRPAFDAYLRLVASSSITPERKVLFLKKIAPLAKAPEALIDMISLAGSLQIYPAYFFVLPYLKDQPEDVMMAAGEAIKNFDLPDADKFISMFNSRDLSGWHGLVGNPVTRAAMKPSELASAQKEADKAMLSNWSVKDGLIVFNGEGDNLCSVKDYSDFEMFVDWRISKKGDSGIYLRGCPQVQIWDTSRTDVGAQVGSGGLYNNQVNTSVPLKVADNPVGEWNTFRILMTGSKVSVWLNGELVTDNVVMENYWDRSKPIFDNGPVELQAHGTDLAFRDIMIREIKSSEYGLSDEEKTQGFVSLFNGRNLDGWTGNKVSYGVEDGNIVITPGDDSGGNLYTEKEYSDFVFRFEFQLTPGANNGLGIRAPLTGDAAYVGMELQILDNTDPIYADLHPWQYHGSVYGVIPAKRGFLKPVGEWNYEEVVVKGTRIQVILNNTVIVDGDIADARDHGTIDGKDHPGLKNNAGHIGFLGHGSIVRFRNIRIKELR